MSIRQFAFISGALAALCGTARAQTLRVADSLLEHGRLARAESLYYNATGNRPSDPAARRALGEFLIARGAPRVGATLLEEAIKFGGDRASIERDLDPVYLLMGDYHLLAALTTTPAASRDRAKWLVSNETRTIAPDSLVIVPLHAADDDASIGKIQVRVNGRTLDAAIIPEARGIVVSDASAAPLRLRVFPAPGSGSKNNGVLAVADSMSIGALSMRNTPVTIARVETKAPIAVGLDVLGKFSPTFDMPASRLVMRASGSVPNFRADSVATLWRASELRVLDADAWKPLSEASIARRLHDHRWTLDARHGRLIIER